MSTSLADAAERLLNTQEAADYLRLKKSTLDTWRSSGRYPELTFIRAGGRIRYRLSDLQKWLESRTAGSEG